MTVRCSVILLCLGIHAFLLGPLVLASEDTLETKVAAEIRRARFPLANVAVAVVNARGRLVVGINERELFKPASNQKLLTVATGLHFLGPDYAYDTRVWACAPLSEGVISGDVLIKGVGDPNISGRFHDDQPDYLLRLWAGRLYEAGLRRVSGDVVADDLLFDDERFLPGWKRAQESSWYSAQISALSLNDNCIDVTVRPADTPGRPAHVEIQPPCSLLRIEGTPRTVGRGETSVLVHRKTGTNTITIKGQIHHAREFWKGHVTVDDPALFFASAFADALRAAGVRVDGTPRKRGRPAGGLGGAAQEPVEKCKKARLLVQHTSSLAQDLPVIQKNSQNLHAELLLKTVGARVFGEGSRAGGERAVRKYLEKKGIPAGEVVFGDGSGLSHANRVTASLLARLLHAQRSEEYFATFRGALPVAGVDGTLKRRFRAPSPARGNVLAKTGFIRGVSALSGYVERGDEAFSFSILVNGFPPRARSPKDMQQRICEALYRALPAESFQLAK